MKTMTTPEALFVIIREAQRKRTTKRSYQQSLRALRTLGLSGDNLRQALDRLDYVDVNGNPYAYLK